MLITAGLTLLALFASVALTLAGKGSPVAVAHLAFAVGIVPLIFAAMLHFVPVLTRTGSPGRGLRLLPTAAQIIGLPFAPVPRWAGRILAGAGMRRRWPACCWRWRRF